VRDQYAGDISDFLKYALLRALAATDRKLGVAWYYNPEHDGRTDGGHTEYASESKWSRMDSPLHQALVKFNSQSASEPSSRIVANVESLPIWPDATVFHGLGELERVPNLAARRWWLSAMLTRLKECNLVFLDPDNGTRSLFRATQAQRYAGLDEVRGFRRPYDRALLLIKFPARVEFDRQEDELHGQLRHATGAERILTMRTSAMVQTKTGRWVPRFRWFTLLDHDDALGERLERFARVLNSVEGVKASVRRGV
jgi:hypothetical protein